MDKYDGIEHAQVTVYPSAIVLVRKRTKTLGLLRYIAALLIIAVAFAGNWLDVPYVAKVSDIVKSAVCYDMLSQDNLGEVPAFNEFKEDKDKEEI